MANCSMLKVNLCSEVVVCFIYKSNENPSPRAAKLTFHTFTLHWIYMRKIQGYGNQEEFNKHWACMSSVATSLTINEWICLKWAQFLCFKQIWYLKYQVTLQFSADGCGNFLNVSVGKEILFHHEGIKSEAIPRKFNLRKLWIN